MSLVNVDIDLLRTLMVLAETRSFTLTGERLLRTQSAVSLQLKRLEQLVGQTLVERGSGREAKLTRYGEIVRNYALEILRLNDALVNDFDRDNVKSVIRLGTPDEYAQLILPKIIKNFSREHPGTEFQIVSDLSTNLSHLVDVGHLDLAFMTWNSGIKGIRVADEPLSWVAAPNAKALSQDYLPLALSPQGCRTRDIATDALDQQGRRWRMAYCSSQFAPLRTVIAEGEAIGILPQQAVPTDLMRVGHEHGLPSLPHAPLVIKVATMAAGIIHQLASTIAKSLHPVFGRAEAMNFPH